MNIKTNWLILILPFFLASGADAQVIDRYVRSKANVVTRRAFEKADEKVDSILIESVDKQVDKQFEKSAGENDQEDTSKDGSSTGSRGQSSRGSGAYNALLNKMGGIGTPANIPQNYNFKGYLLMEMEAWDDQGEKQAPVLYKTFYSEDTKSFAMEFTESGKNSLIIFDNNIKAMIILADDGTEKSGIVMPLNADDSIYNSDAETTGPGKANEITAPEATDFSLIYPNYKKTGNKKNISGYICEEHTYEDDTEIVSFWLTNDLPADLYSRIFSLNNFASLGYSGVNQGFTMEWDYRKKGNTERSKMVVKEVDKNKSSTINTSGYNVISLGNFNP